MNEKKHKWGSATEWLQEKAKEWDDARLYNELMFMAESAGEDVVHDAYQPEMIQDGFFEPIKYVIVSLKEKDDDGSPLYWNNEDGWVDKDSATTFSHEEKQMYHLPFNSKWEAHQ